MNQKINKYLYDIKISIESINEYLGDNRNFYDFQNNKQLKRATERELEIIGEAMKNIINLDNSLSFTNARQIVNTRNWVIHNYDKVDEVIIWGIITKHLPILKLEVEKYLTK
jgi:uncharacterized protein with HEPN domain